MKLLFELSGENPTLPFAEIGCVGTVIDQRLQVAVAECPDPGAALRLAMTRIVLEYLGECEPDPASFRELLRELALETTRTFAGRVKKVHGGCYERNPRSQREFERLIGTMVQDRSPLLPRKRNTGQYSRKTAAILAGCCSRSTGLRTMSGTPGNATSSTRGS